MNHILDPMFYYQATFTPGVKGKMESWPVSKCLSMILKKRQMLTEAGPKGTTEFLHKVHPCWTQ